jgi:hypothetical protein
MISGLNLLMTFWTDTCESIGDPSDIVNVSKPASLNFCTYGPPGGSTTASARFAFKLLVAFRRFATTT